MKSKLFDMFLDQIRDKDLSRVSTLAPSANERNLVLIYKDGDKQTIETGLSTKEYMDDFKVFRRKFYQWRDVEIAELGDHQD